MEITAAVSREDQPSPRLETVELGGPRAGEILVRVVATGICHSDLMFHGQFGAMFAPKPIVLGHEGSGIVEAVGIGVTALEPGDHVVLSGNSCGHCPNCHSGRTVYCDHMVKLCWSGGRADGTSPISQCGHQVSGVFFGQSSFATHVIAPERSAVKVPRDVPLHLLGPLGCAMVTGAGSVLEALSVRPGQSIAIFGTGSVGLAAVMAAKIAGASRIVAVDVNKERLELAKSLGASDVIHSDAETGGALRQLEPRGFDFSFITASAPQVFDAATACLGVGGTAGYVIFPREPWVPNLERLMTGGCKLQGIIGGFANPQTGIPLLIDYWRKGMFPFERLITEYRFDQIDQAWEQYRSGQVIKPVLRM
ncbi:aryl-alcohol dehydrogenase [Novosphingobium chloroacetimidivorans]|uniref:Aryl-alcohol dehydrogenase n=1 Tax=Novosphingobium chloroacetimidivorans TaxID=1428314 RepID=A0A7W7NX57_9SPHN|nr:NAD(P)-dependent alcohol dehydrogenase [Novosphingobium chloroacetimidivorans]MBB4860318.1 aryl-alcohol dehydrogenase [Novosphingobium chloroacetimidivorans]